MSNQDAKKCPECGRPMEPQKAAPWFQVCDPCGKGWNVNYDPPEIYWEISKKERERRELAKRI